MFVRTLQELEALERIKFPAKAFRSARFITADDALGFSYNDNRVEGGVDLEIWLKHHWEANYIASGRGEVTDLTTSESWPLEAGVLYVVGPNDRHRLHLTEDERHISVFHPALTGNERFDEDGSYEPSGPIEPTDRRMFVKSVRELHEAGRQVLTFGGRLRTIPMLTEQDDLGFGLADVRLEADLEITLGGEALCQSNHVIAGEGRVRNLRTGETWEIAPETSFALTESDRVRVEARSDLHLLNLTCPARKAAVY